MTIKEAHFVNITQMYKQQLITKIFNLKNFFNNFKISAMDTQAERFYLIINTVAITALTI